jgi:hypothetical protein
VAFTPALRSHQLGLDLRELLLELVRLDLAEHPGEAQTWPGEDASRALREKGGEGGTRRRTLNDCVASLSWANASSSRLCAAWSLSSCSADGRVALSAAMRRSLRVRSSSACSCQCQCWGKRRVGKFLEAGLQKKITEPEGKRVTYPPQLCQPIIAAFHSTLKRYDLFCQAVNLGVNRRRSM